MSAFFHSHNHINRYYTVTGSVCWGTTTGPCKRFKLHGYLPNCHSSEPLTRLIHV